MFSIITCVHIFYGIYKKTEIYYYLDNKIHYLYLDNEHIITIIFLSKLSHSSSLMHVIVVSILK